MHPPLSPAFPFGAPLRPVLQTDRRHKKVFVLGAYASAVHAKWIGPDERVLSFALAVASEPTIFWDGRGAETILAGLSIPQGAGRLVPADAQLNGPSGRSLDQEYVSPLGLTRRDVWLCDLVPHACMNDGQKAAIKRAYEPRMTAFGLPEVTVPAVPRSLADEQRREEIDAELVEARPDVLVLLGDEPMTHYLKPRDARWRSLASFGHGEDYGKLHETTVAGVRLSVLPLVHPRQASGLGKHSGSWRRTHAAWKARPDVLELGKLFTFSSPAGPGF